MKIALVDDDALTRERLAGLISRQLFAMDDYTHRIDRYESGEEFLSLWSAGSHDLIVLDIFMGGMLGIDVARKVRESDRDARIVFCTSSNDFACESYEVGAHYYLHKPFTEESIKRMLDRLDIEILELIRAVTLPDGQAIVLRNILYTQYSGHTVEIHSKKRDTIRSRLTQGELETLLCEQPYLYCCSKGVIVNFHEVERMGDDTFTLSDGSVVPISRRKAKAVSDAYTRFRFEKMRKEARP